MRTEAMVLAVALVTAPLGAQAAELVGWWEKGYNSEEDKAVREIVAAFEQDTGKEVELDQPSQNGIEAEALAAIEAR
jgi:ABC-type glycerol-3-phosphate transport system substrate-binding protein